MKRMQVLLIAGIMTAICLTGCGKDKEEPASSEIESITVEEEAIPEEEEKTEEAEDVYVDDEELTNGDGEYTVNIYAQGSDGVWSDDQ